MTRALKTVLLELDLCRAKLTAARELAKDNVADLHFDLLVTGAGKNAETLGGLLGDAVTPWWDNVINRAIEELAEQEAALASELIASAHEKVNEFDQ